MDDRFVQREPPWGHALPPQPPLQQQHQHQFRGDGQDRAIAWREQQQQGQQAVAEHRWRTNNNGGQPGAQSPQEELRPAFVEGRPPEALAQRSPSSSLTDQTRTEGNDPNIGPPWHTCLGAGCRVAQPRSFAQFGASAGPHRPPMSMPHRSLRLPVRLTLNICDDLIHEVNNVLTGKPVPAKSEPTSVASGSLALGAPCSEAAAEDSAASGQNSKTASAKRSAKLSLVPGNDGKIKASNFHAHSVSIGQWKCRSRHEGDLVAKVYFAKKKLVWEILEGELKKKIEFQWTDICAMRVLTPESGSDVWEIDLKSAPTFHREMNPQPKKHTLWEACADFTNGQASNVFTHRVLFPNSTLERHYERLMAFDSRLSKMMEEQGNPKAKPELSDDTVKGSLNLSAGTDLLAPDGPLSLQELRYRDPVMPEHDLSLPPQLQRPHLPHPNPMEQQQQNSPSNQPFFHMPGYSSQFPRVPLDHTPGGSLDGLPPHLHQQQQHPGIHGGAEDVMASHNARFNEWVRSAQFQGVPQQQARQPLQQQQPSRTYEEAFQQQQAMHQEAKRQRMMMAAELGMPPQQYAQQPQMSPQQQQQAWAQREAMMQQEQHARYAQHAMFSNGA